jgi:hypothetical protein
VREFSSIIIFPQSYILKKFCFVSGGMKETSDDNFKGLTIYAKNSADTNFTNLGTVSVPADLAKGRGGKG